MAVQIQLRTAALQALRDELGIELREFDRQQRQNMIDATNLVRRVVRRNIRSLGLVRTGRLRRAARRRVRRVGPGEYEGEVHFGRRSRHGRQFLAHFQEFGTRHHAATPFLALTLEETLDRVTEIVGESHKVWFAGSAAKGGGLLRGA